MKRDLPIYDIVLDDEDWTHGVGFISLVDDPAINVNWVKLARQSMNFRVSSDKQLLYGPFLIPNMLIERYDENKGGYYVRFSKEEIEKIATKFNQDLHNRNINFMHTDEMVDGFVASNWIIEGDQDKSKNLKFDLPEGTWFGGVKINDTSFWEDKVKNEEVKGFSVEILADLTLSLKNKNNEMSKMKFKKKFIAKRNFEAEGEAVEPVTDEVIVVAEEIAVGEPVVVIEDDLKVDENYTGEVVVSNDEVTDYEGEGDLVLVIEDGNITEIKPEEGAIEEDFEEVPNDGGSPLTAEEVSQMIDARFSELQEEISNIKKKLDVSETETEDFKKSIASIKEKLSSTPATETIIKDKSPVSDRFKKMEERIQNFAKQSK